MHFVTKPGTSVTEQDRQVTAVQDELFKIPGVEHVGTHIGQALLGEEVNGVNFSENWISLSPSARTTPRRWRRSGPWPPATPGPSATCRPTCTSGSTRCSRTAPPKTWSCASSARAWPSCRSWGPRWRPRSGTVPGLVDVHPAALEFIPEADVTVNLAAAKRYGLTPGNHPPGRGRHDGQRAGGGDPGRRQDLHGLGLEHASHPREPEQPAGSCQVDTPNGGHVALGKVATVYDRPQPQPDLPRERRPQHRGRRERQRPQSRLGHGGRPGRAGEDQAPARLPHRTARRGHRAGGGAAAAALRRPRRRAR